MTVAAMLLLKQSDPDLDNKVQRIRVDLPGLAPELINTLKKEGISFDIHPPEDSATSPWLAWQSALPFAVDRSIDFSGSPQ